MSDQDGKDQGPEPAPEGAKAHQVFLDLLEESGFFQQINNLEESLKAITAELQSFGENAKERMEEIENLSAHVLAENTEKGAGDVRTQVQALHTLLEQPQTLHVRSGPVRLLG